MKLPASLGQKKTKAIEQMLEEVGVGKTAFSDTSCSVMHNAHELRHCAGK